MTISFEDFKKLEIRISTIINAEPVADTDKLIQLTVDLGEENSRTIVAGIAEYFENVQDIVGKQVPILVNLEPRELRGVRSEGMMLGVGGAGFTLLGPAGEVDNGSEVR